MNTLPKLATLLKSAAILHPWKISHNTLQRSNLCRLIFKQANPPCKIYHITQTYRHAQIYLLPPCKISHNVLQRSNPSCTIFKRANSLCKIHHIAQPYRHAQIYHATVPKLSTFLLIFEQTSPFNPNLSLLISKQIFKTVLKLLIFPLKPISFHLVFKRLSSQPPKRTIPPTQSFSTRNQKSISTLQYIKILHPTRNPYLNFPLPLMFFLFKIKHLRLHFPCRKIFQIFW